MPMSVPFLSRTLLTLVLVLSPAYGQDVGEACTIDDSNGPASGVCKRLDNCDVVYKQLLAGRLPKTTCGYDGMEPVVCCPTNVITVSPTSKQTTSPTSRTETPSTVGTLTENRRGTVARAVCAENSKEVYGLEQAPVFTFGNAFVNVSRCVVKSLKLIIGGEKANPKEFPHMVAIGFESNQGIQWLCGGSLISNRIVLTAAHCTYQSDLGRAKWARVGDLNLVQTNDDARPQTIRIIDRIRHPEYQRQTHYHDIAIMKLETPVTYNAWVRPACLPVDLPDIGTDNKAVATGWGRVDWADEEGSDNLMKVTLNLVPQAICNESFADGNNGQLSSGIVDEWQICAGEFGKDTCQGDSGGPLAIFSKVHWCMYNVIGITSLGRVCGSIDPGVYTRVYHYIPWIEKTAWPEYF